MRKYTVLMALVLCLCLAVPAQGAPHRDERTLLNGGTELETAVSLFGGAALMRDVYTVAEGEDVPQAMAEGALVLGFGRHLLPNVDGDPTDGTETTDKTALEGMLAKLFSGPAQSVSPGGKSGLCRDPESRSHRSIRPVGPASRNICSFREC